MFCDNVKLYFRRNKICFSQIFVEYFTFFEVYLLNIRFCEREQINYGNIFNLSAA